jgi:flagellar motor switch protein FliN/FliY
MMAENEANDGAGQPLEVEATASAQPMDAPAAAAAAKADDRASLDLVIDLPVQIAVEIGRTKLLLRDVLELGHGSVLELDRGSNEPADIFVNGRLIARGDLTSMDDRLAVRIVELIAPTGPRAEDA